MRLQECVGSFSCARPGLIVWSAVGQTDRGLCPYALQDTRELARLLGELEEERDALQVELHSLRQSAGLVGHPPSFLHAVLHSCLHPDAAA